MKRIVEKSYLERFHPFVPVSFKLKDVKKYFSESPSKFEDKRLIELLCGAILSTSARITFRENFEIVLLLRPEASKKYKSKPSIDQIISDNQIADTDVDCILISKSRVFFVQLTRLVQSRKYGDSTKNLFQLIKKKCNVQEDKNMVLVVLCDVTFKLNTNKLYDYVESLVHFPYSRLYLIAQLGEQAEKGQYHCISIFPELQEPQAVMLKLH